MCISQASRSLCYLPSHVFPAVAYYSHDGHGASDGTVHSVSMLFVFPGGAYKRPCLATQGLLCRPRRSLYVPLVQPAVYQVCIFARRLLFFRDCLKFRYNVVHYYSLSAPATDMQHTDARREVSSASLER